MFTLHLRAINGGEWPLDAWTPFFVRGYLWVDFFFILSGFVLAHVHGDEFRKRFAWRTYAAFLKRRLDRIYPLHFVVLLAWAPIVLAQHFVGHSREDALSLAGTFVSNLLLIQAWGIHDVLSWNRPAWSISAEWAAYLSFPVVVWLIGMTRPIAAFVLVALAWVGLDILVMQQEHRSLNLSYDFGVLRCLTVFALGVGVYRTYRSIENSELGSLAGSDVSCGLAVLAVVAAIHGLTNESIILPLFAWLTLAFALNVGPASRLLSWSPLRWLGRVSYSIYLIHWPIIMSLDLVISKVAPHDRVLPVVGMAVALIATLVVARYTYRYVEVPWNRPRLPTSTESLSGTAKA